MQASSYQIDVKDFFNGPVDLLLYLVRKQEVDVLEVSLADITKQFLEYLEVLEIIDFDIAADFLVAASAMLEMKSRLALIKDETVEQEEEVEAEETNHNLVQHLLQYQQLREAAEALQEQALAWQDRYPRLADERPSSKRSVADDVIKDLEIWDLVGAFARIVKKKTKDGEATVRFDETPIHVYVEQIGQQVRETGRVRFQDLFSKEDDRSKSIGMFLAILELLRHHHYRAEQEQDFAEIWILPPLENVDRDNEDAD
ncbi:segregation/condensation protein A [uncultured Rubinisphaera sp.]|uniref:segregation and condensation protein A n=1 Tax=uncultured Rubinisphaera sp. TaxID=1678686 RepID=UPI0030D87A16